MCYKFCFIKIHALTFLNTKTLDIRFKSLYLCNVNGNKPDDEQKTQTEFKKNPHFKKPQPWQQQTTTSRQI